MAGTAPAPAIEEALRAAAQEGRQLYLGTRVARLAEPPSSAAFLRDWVGPRRPCVVRGALEGWACVKDGRWGRAAYLRERLAGRTVTISLTPDGRADAVRRFAAGGGGVTLPPGAAGGAGSREYFVLPDDHKMEIGAFLEHLRERSEEHTSELQSLAYLVCRLLLEKKKSAPHPRRSHPGTEGAPPVPPIPPGPGPRGRGRGDARGRGGMDGRGRGASPHPGAPRVARSLPGGGGAGGPERRRGSSRCGTNSPPPPPERRSLLGPRRPPQAGGAGGGRGGGGGGGGEIGRAHV